MKNLIQVLALLLLPLVATAASANNHVFGSLHVFAGKVEGGSGINLNSYSSRLGIKGVNALPNKWVLSHKLELELDTFNDALEGGGVRKLPSGIEIKQDEDAELNIRNAWLGVTADWGEFRVGRHASVYDIVDDGQNLLSKVGQALPSSRERTEQLLFIKKSGLMAYSIAYAPFENESEDRVVSGLVNYAKGPYYAGLGMEKSSGLTAGSKLSLGYSEDKYDLGLVYDRQLGSSARSLTLTGLYRFGKMYLGAELGKVLSGDVLYQDQTVKFAEDTKNRALELGYQWKKDTKLYLDYSHLGNRKEASIAVRHEF